VKGTDAWIAESIKTREKKNPKRKGTGGGEKKVVKK